MHMDAYVDTNSIALTINLFFQVLVLCKSFLICMQMCEQHSPYAVSLVKCGDHGRRVFRHKGH